MTKIELAKTIISKADELGVTLRPQDNWIIATPPNKLPVELLMQMGKLANEIGDLLVLRNTSPATDAEKHTLDLAEAKIKQRRAAACN